MNCTELEIAGCQWPKEGQFVKMVGKNKTGLPNVKKMASEIQLTSVMPVYISFDYHNLYGSNDYWEVLAPT